MGAIDELEPFDAEGRLRVVIDSPAGSTITLRYQASRGVFTGARPLPVGLRYPYDCGFVPGTRAADGEPVGAFVIGDLVTFPGLVVLCHPIGVLAVDQDGEGGARRIRKDRVVAVSDATPNADHLRSCRQLAEDVRTAMVEFLLAAGRLEDRHVVALGFRGPAAATALIDAARQRRAELYCA